MNETIEIKRSNVLASYEEARKAGANGYMQFLENLFGKELFKPKVFRPKDVRDRVKTFEDACSELGDEHRFVQAYTTWVSHEEHDDQTDITAYLKLRIICAALNEGWIPQFTKDEERSFPKCRLYEQIEIDKRNQNGKNVDSLISTCGYHTEYDVFAYTFPYRVSLYLEGIGARLCLESPELAEYFGKQFIDILADFLLIRK